MPELGSAAAIGSIGCTERSSGRRRAERTTRRASSGALTPLPTSGRSARFALQARRARGRGRLPTGTARTPRPAAPSGAREDDAARTVRFAHASRGAERLGVQHSPRPADTELAIAHGAAPDLRPALDREPLLGLLIAGRHIGIALPGRRIEEA